MFKPTTCLLKWSRSLLLSKTQLTKSMFAPSGLRLYSTSPLAIERRTMSAGQALTQFIKGGNRVFIQTGCGVPKHLIANLESLVEEKEHVFGMNGGEKVDFAQLIICYYPDQLPPYLNPKYREYFHTTALFNGPVERYAINEIQHDEEPLIDYLPIYLREGPRLVKSGKFPIDVALIQVSPPDSEGYCSLGVSIDMSLAAVESARYVIAQVNNQVPRTYGDGRVHVSKIDAFVHHDEPLSEMIYRAPTQMEEKKKIGVLIASLIPDRACLQLGIGDLPACVFENLKNHKDLGVHSGLISDGVLDLIEYGVVTNKYKNFHPDKFLCTIVMGTKKIYDWVHENPEIIFKGADYVNNISNIAKNDNFIAINSAIEVDLTGQVCSDSIGPKMYSGIGGQMDFISGASYSKGGIPIIAIPSTTKDGESKIVLSLKEGAGVVLTRADVHFVITEFGIAELYGKGVRQRAKALIKIAHPMHRDRLTMEARQVFGYL